jgi:NTE family protein
MTTTRSASARPTTGRALVLGGGGSTGNAWLIGVVAGLLEAGLDVTDADLVVGTSAGSTAAAQVTSARATDLLAALLEAPSPVEGGPVPDHAAHGWSGSERQRAVGRDLVSPGTNPTTPPTYSSRPGQPSVVNHLERTSAIIAAAGSAADMRRRIGAAALELDGASDDAVRERWRATVAARLPSQEWPERALLITAIDAHTGDGVVLDRHSGVELVDAIAASCSSGTPYRIGDRRYLDGGYRRNENADLAAGHERVLVLSPFGGRTRHPLEWGMQLAAQVGELRAGGSRVETIFPQSSAEHLFGARAMDVSLRPAAARAGHQQGRALAAELADFWR